MTTTGHGEISNDSDTKSIVPYSAADQSAPAPATLSNQVWGGGRLAILVTGLHDLSALPLGYRHPNVETKDVRRQLRAHRQPAEVVGVEQNGGTFS
jgi:hypothetical protein